MAVFFDAKGTTQSSFQIQKGGGRITNNAGNLEVRNAAAALSDLLALNLSAQSAITAGDATHVGSLIAYGDANKVTFQYAAGQTSDQTYIFPKDGTSGQVLSTDGSGNLSWITVSAPSVPTDLVRVASKAIVFGDEGSAVNHKLLPIGAIVLKTEVIIDIAWDVADATIQVGKAGTVAKYMAAGDNILNGSAGDTSIAEKGNAAITGSAEQVIVTVTAGIAPAGAGAARVLIYYCQPEVL